MITLNTRYSSHNSTIACYIKTGLLQLIAIRISKIPIRQVLEDTKHGLSSSGEPQEI